MHAQHSTTLVIHPPVVVQLSLCAPTLQCSTARLFFVNTLCKKPQHHVCEYAMQHCAAPVFTITMDVWMDEWMDGQSTDRPTGKHWQSKGRIACPTRHMVIAVRNCAPTSHLAMRNRVLPLDLAVRNCAPSFFSLAGKPLKCRPHPMMVFIGTASEGWGFCVVFSIVVKKSCCTKPTEKQTKAPSRAPLRRGKHAAPGGYI